MVTEKNMSKADPSKKLKSECPVTNAMFFKDYRNVTER